MDDNKNTLTDKRSMPSETCMQDLDVDSRSKPNSEMAMVASCPQRNGSASDGDDDSDVENVALVPFGAFPENSKMVVPDTKKYSHTMKTGDVGMEQKVFDRMDTLGLLEKKKELEKQLAEKLDKEMAKTDHIVGAISRSRRQREVRDRVNLVKNEIHNTIRTRVHKDESGTKFYKVQLLMGKFTRNVRHSVAGNEVFISGSSPNGSCLVKETQIEFPDSVDMTKVQASFKAGVFKIDVPFKSQSSVGSMTSSSGEDTTVYSGMSDGTCSTDDPFSEPEMDITKRRT